MHLDLEAKGNTHSQLSEDALREKVHKALKERKQVRRRRTTSQVVVSRIVVLMCLPPCVLVVACQITTKVYLVKWKDLGYSACTWERPEDLKVRHARGDRVMVVIDPMLTGCSLLFLRPHCVARTTS